MTTATNAQNALNSAQTSTIAQLATGAYPTELAKQLYFLAYAEKIIATAEGVIEENPATEGTLASILANIPSSLGQKNKAGSFSVAIASDQEDLGVAVSNFPVSQAINGSVTANIGNLGQQNKAGSLSVAIASDQEDLGVSVSNFPANQTINGSVTANIGSSGDIATQATVANIETAIGDIGTANTVLNLLQQLFNKDNTIDTTGLATSVNQDSVISNLSNLRTQSPNVSSPATRVVTHIVYKDLDNDGLDDADGTSPATTTISAGKRFIGWFVRSGFPTINGVSWFPQEEENLRPDLGEVLDSISIDFTGAEVLVSYY